MGLSTKPLTYLLATIAVILQSADGLFSNSATVDAYVTKPRSTSTPVADAIIGPEDATTSAQSEDATDEPRPSTQPPIESTTVSLVAETGTVPNDATTSAQSVDVTEGPQPPTPSTAAVTALPFPGPTPVVKLVCPNDEPDHFLSAIWTRRLQKQGFSSTYTLLNLTSDNALLIHGDTCKHTATYRCTRTATVGYTTKVYSFSFANCTVVMRKRQKADGRSNSTAVALGNTSTRLISSLVLAIGPMVGFISIY